MSKLTKVEIEQLQAFEEAGAKSGWVAPPVQGVQDYIVHLRKVFARYNIVPSKATPIEHDFVTKVAESEFYGMVI